MAVWETQKEELHASRFAFIWKAKLFNVTIGLTDMYLAKKLPHNWTDFFLAIIRYVCMKILFLTVFKRLTKPRYRHIWW